MTYGPPEDQVAEQACDHCDGTGEVFEECGCNACEYASPESDHSGMIPCANCEGKGVEDE
jgi:RecJ-like exonuclease